MKIFIDDGSTNIKLAWLEDGDVKTLISPNSFKPEWSFSLLDDAAPANYEIDGEKFSFDPLSADAVVTTETRYQYSDVNVVAIQHALQQTGLKRSLLMSSSHCRSLNTLTPTIRKISKTLKERKKM